MKVSTEDAVRTPVYLFTGPLVNNMKGSGAL